MEQSCLSLLGFSLGNLFPNKASTGNILTFCNLHVFTRDILNLKLQSYYRLSIILWKLLLSLSEMASEEIKNINKSFIRPFLECSCCVIWNNLEGG
jgi:hypothetical protein